MIKTTKILKLLILFTLSSCSSVVCQKGFLKSEKSKALACYEDKEIVAFFIKSKELEYKRSKTREYFYIYELPKIDENYSFEQAKYDFRVQNAREISVDLNFEIKKKEVILIKNK